MKNIVLLELNTFGYGRAVTEAVVNTVRARGLPWTFHVADWHSDGRRLARLNADGLIASVADEAVPIVREQVAVPTVLIGSIRPRDGTAAVGGHDQEIGRLAAEHLLGRLCSRFACLDLPFEPYVALRSKAFRRTIRAAGFRASTFTRWHTSHAAAGVPLPVGDARVLADWVRSLPKPVAVFAVNDSLAVRLIEACRIAGAAVPAEVAILGVDDDALLCKMAFPPLSSVRQPTDHIGRHAVELLIDMMNGADPPRTPVLLPPIGVVTRQSTDVLAVDEPYLAMALRLIHERTGSPLSVAAILAEVPVTRRWLERRFRQALGHSPLHAIHRAKVDRAQQLLRGTTMPMADIARQCGLRNGKRLSTLFRQHTGRTPREYRRLGLPTGEEPSRHR